MEKGVPSFMERASLAGVSLGVYLTLLAVAAGFATAYWPVGLVVWGLSIGLPFYLYNKMRRSYGLTKFEMTLGTLWSEGVLSFFLGAAIQAVVVYILLTYVTPHFLETLITDTVSNLQTLGTPEALALAEQFEQIISSGSLPRPVDVAYNCIFTNTLIGVVMILVVCMILVWRYRNPQRRERLLEFLSKHPF